MSSNFIPKALWSFCLFLILSLVALPVAAQSASDQIQAAKLSLQQGKDEEAFALFSQVLERDPGLLSREAPEGVQFLFQQTVEIAGQGDYEKARYWLNLLAQAAPDSSHLFGFLGICSSRLGDSEGAEKAFLKALELDPNEPFLWAERGIALMRSQEMSKAEHALDQAIKLESDEPDVYLYRGILWQRSRNWDEARALYRRALELHPESALGWYLMGTSLRDTDLREDAVAPLKKAAELAPTNPEVHYALGLVYLRLGHVELYREQLKTLQELKSDRAQELEEKFRSPEKLDQTESVWLDALPH